MLDFRINTFLEVCRCMNYTKAAEQLHITQPAVSQHIRYLEHLYETELFHHEGKKISLTPSGKLLLRTATALKSDETLMISRMQREAQKKQPMVFGTTMTIAEFVIGKPLARYIANHPDTQVKMVMGNTTDLLEGLQNGSIHFALVEGYFPAEEYESMVFSREDFFPVCAAGHVFSRTPRRVGDLLTEDLLVREPGSGTRAILENVLSVRNISLERFAKVTEIGSMAALVQLLKLDCGIAFLHRAAVKQELRTGALQVIELPDFKMNHDFAFIWNKGSVFAENYRRICREFQGLDANF